MAYNYTSKTKCKYHILQYQGIFYVSLSENDKIYKNRCLRQNNNNNKKNKCESWIKEQEKMKQTWKSILQDVKKSR